MKVWKKNMVAAAILVTVCAGIYINWLYTEDHQVSDFVDTLDEEKLMSDDLLDMSNETSVEQATTSSEYFAAVRLSRQEARDSAVSLLQEAMSYETDASGEVTTVSVEMDSVLVMAAEEAAATGLTQAEKDDIV